MSAPAADSIAMDDSFDPYKKWLGIAPKDQPPNHYRLLGVELFEDDPDVINNASDQRMVHVRTFQQGPHSAFSQRILNELATARRCLLGERTRAEYDEQLRRKLDSESAPQPLRGSITSESAAQPTDPAPIGSTRQPIPIGKQSKMPALIALAVVASLLVGGGVVAAVFIWSDDVVHDPIQVAVPLDEDPSVTPATVGDNTPKPSNDARHPQFAAMSDIMVPAGHSMEFDVRYAGDPPTADYSIQLTKGPDEVTVNAATGRFRWTPTAATGNGSHTVAIDLVALDTKATVSNVTFNIIVQGVDRPLILQRVAEQEVKEGEALSVPLSATDPDSAATTIDYTVSNAPTGLSIDSRTGVISWTPQTGQGGKVYHVFVSATPGDGSLGARTAVPIRCVAASGATDGRGLMAEIFANRDLTGKLAEQVVHPVEWYFRDQKTVASRRGSSMRLTGWLKPPQPGAYEIIATVGGQIRARFGSDETLRIDDRRIGDVRQFKTKIESDGSLLPVHLEYAAGGRASILQLRWERPDGVNELIPAAALFHNESVALAADSHVEPTPGPQAGLQMEVFPQFGFRRRVTNEVVARIDENWLAAPPKGIQRSSAFSIRWTANLQVPKPGEYRVAVVHDGSCQLKLDGKSVAYSTGVQGPGHTSASIELTGEHALELVYFHRSGPALCSLRWVLPGEDVERVVPTSAFSFDRAKLVGKTSVPSAPLRKTASQQLQEEFADEIQQAQRDRGAKFRIARRWIRLARAGSDKPEMRFAMLDAARNLSAKAGNPVLAWEAIATMDGQFLLDNVTELKTIALRDATRDTKGRAAASTLSLLYLQLFSELEQAAAFQTAFELLPAAAVAARKSECANLRAEITARGKDLRALVKEEEAFKKVLLALKQNPDDRAAQFQHGRYLCLIAGRWQEGLPLLARSEDADYRAVAGMELAKPETRIRLLALADAWSKLAADEQDIARQRAQERALYWYEKIALPGKGAPPPGLSAKMRNLRAALSRVKLPALDTKSLNRQRLTEFVKNVLASEGSSIGLKGLWRNFSNLREFTEAVKRSNEEIVITRVSIISAKATDDTMRILGRIKSLEEISVTSPRITSKGVGYLRGLENLDSLTIVGSRVDDHAVLMLLPLDNLEFLHLQSDQLTGRTLGQLKSMESLSRLSLASPLLAGPAVVEVARIPSIYELRFSSGPVEPIVFAELRSMSSLRSLHLKGVSIGEETMDESLREVAELKRLSTLATRTDVTAAGIRHLKDSDLYSLQVESGRIGDEDLAAFAALPNLTSLTLKTRPIGDQGAVHLARIDSLTQLEIANADRVSDAGLRSLESLESASLIRLTNATYSFAAFVRFRNAVPDCELYPKRYGPGQR